MKRRSFITAFSSTAFLPLINIGCSLKKNFPDSRHLIHTPDKRTEYIATMLKALCTELGPHPVGTPNFEKAIRIVTKEMKRALPIVELDYFPFERWILISEPEFYVGDKWIEAYPSHGTSGTIENGIKGVLRRSETSRVEYDMVDSSTDNVIAYITIAPKDKAVPRPYWFYDDKPGGLPNVCIGKKAKPILEIALKNKTPVRLNYQVEFIPNTMTTNVVGTLPGESTDEIVYYAHLDTVYSAPGANDNTATLIMMLMVAHAQSGIKPKKTLKFIATTGEEYGYLGAKHYANKRKENGTLSNIKFIFDFDSVTWGPDMHLYTNDEELVEVIQSIDEELNVLGTPKWTKRPGLGRESIPFKEAGLIARGIVIDSVPLGNINTICWHRPDDIPAYVKPEYVEISFLLFNEFIRRIQKL